MTDPFLTQLDSIAQPGTSAATFLKKLGPIHNNWHVAHNGGIGQTGFLLFHWELIKRFKAVDGEAHFGGVAPFTTANFTSYHAPFGVQVAVPSGGIVQLEEFSAEVEQWHNDAHMAVGMAFHKNLMNPKTNVKLVIFWRLHYFINDRFEETLAHFSPGPPSAAIVALLESGAGVGVI